MNLMKKSIVVLFVCCFICACSVTKQRSNEAQLNVSGLAFYNNSSDVVTNVTVTAIKTGKMVTCNLIDVKNHCGTGFPVAQYRGGLLRVKWQSRNGNKYEHEIIIELPKPIEALTKYIAVLKVEEKGNLTAFFMKNPRVF